MSDSEKILILSVGGSPEPLIYSINEFKPDKIIFLHSPQTYYECAKVLNKVNFDINISFKHDLNEIVGSFEKSYKEKEKEKNKDNCEKKEYLTFKEVCTIPTYDKIIGLLKENIPNLLDNNANYEENIFTAEIPDPEILDDSFTISRKVFSKFTDEKKYKVKVDFTGGTKPMVSGIVLAVVEGNFSNFKFSYVGSKDSESRNKNGVGIVKDGSEITKMQINPYKKYAITEFKRGINFFNNFQFEAAKVNFEEAKKSLKNENFELDDISLNNKELASIIIELVDFYHKWDIFDEKKSKTLNLFNGLGKILENIDKNEQIYNSFLENELYEQIYLNYEFLSLKFRGIGLDDEEDSDKAKMKYRIKYYLPDLLNNACRRIKEGKYDDAVARLYRANELIAQINLTDNDLMLEDKLEAKKFFLSINNILSKADKRENYKDIDNFIKKYSEKVTYEEKQKYLSLYNKPYDINGSLRIGNDLSYELLDKFDFKNSDKFESVNKKLKGRNSSILAHGLEPIRKKYAKKLYKSTLNYAKDFFPDLDELMKMSEFPKFDLNLIRK